MSSYVYTRIYVYTRVYVHTRIGGWGGELNREIVLPCLLACTHARAHAHSHVRSIWICQIVRSLVVTFSVYMYFLCISCIGRVWQRFFFRMSQGFDVFW